MASVDGLSRALLGTAATLALMAVAGVFSPSFAYDLAFGLAALFGASAAISIFGTTNARTRGALFAIAVALSVIATYVYAVSRVGGPPGTRPTLTPWTPVAIALLLTTGAGLLVRRVTRNPTVAVSTALAVMAAMLAVFAQIATVAYVPAALLAVVAVIGFGVAALDGGRRSQSA